MMSSPNNRIAASCGVATALMVAVLLFLGTRRPAPAPVPAPAIDDVDLPVRFTSTPVTHLTVGSAYTYQVQAEGSGDVVIRISNAPPGMQLTADNRLVMAADAAPKTAFQVVLEARNDANSAEQVFDVIPIRSIVVQQQMIRKEEPPPTPKPEPQPQPDPESEQAAEPSPQPVPAPEQDVATAEPPPTPNPEPQPELEPKPEPEQAAEPRPQPVSEVEVSHVKPTAHDRRQAQAAARAKLLAEALPPAAAQPVQEARQISPTEATPPKSRFEQLRQARLDAQRDSELGAASEPAQLEEAVAEESLQEAPTPASAERRVAEPAATDNKEAPRSVSFGFDFRLADTSFDAFVQLADNLGFRLLLMSVDGRGRPTSTELFQLNRSGGRTAVAPLDLAMLKDWTSNAYNGDFVRVGGVPMDRRTRQAFAAEEAKLRKSMALSSGYQLLAILPYRFIAQLDGSARAFFAANTNTTKQFEEAAGTVRFTVDKRQRIRILSIGN
jgi:hypothetical protein